ncbi:MAG: M23 family metallopeptidase [Ignavibacteriaceae bacterium]|nr:M23 family metallopeptidase [Ignavibacteriaceae bacterium]
MKKFFYFSDSSLEFVEIKNVKTKFISYLAISTVILTLVVFTGYLLISSLTSSAKSHASLVSENEMLKQKLTKVATGYENLRSGIDSLVIVNDQLRTSANLEPIQPEMRLVGIGGSDINFSTEFSISSGNIELTDAIDLVDEITRKFAFEKSQHLEIAKKFKTNEELFKSIPALKPTAGNYSYNGFGMRLHPILKRYKRHEGLDIITDRGTPVFAPGKGEVTFVGRRGGYGLAIEIDHGFGYKTVYAHLSKSIVKKGQHITRGDLIAKTGNTGLSSGPHLHYEVHHNGVKLNPVDFFFDDVNFFALRKDE